MKAARDWHKGFFKNSFYNPASPAAVAKAPEEARFLLKQLKLKKGSRLLDLCCGPGRHAVEFAKKGLAVTGYDFSGEYLREAARRAKKKKVALRLVRGDMRRLKFRDDFDAAVNLFTSFGYFHKFSDDIKVLKGVARSLKPGGRFMLDTMNGGFVRKNFRPRGWTKMPDGSYRLDETVFEKDGISVAWTFLKAGKRPASRIFFIRLYSKKTLAAALKKAGLIPLKFWGDFAGARLTDKTVRLLALAKKPQ